jgi:hypothetical protein
MQEKSLFNRLPLVSLFSKPSLMIALASGSLDVNAFTSARSFEISALENAMRSSK